MGFKPVPLNSPAQGSGARRGIFSIITLGLQGGSRWISNLFIAQFAGSAVFGSVASATSLAMLLNTVWPASTQGAASKFLARARGKEDDAEIHAVANHIAVRVLQVTTILSVIGALTWVLVYHGAWWESLCVVTILVTVNTALFARGIHFGADQVERGTRVDIISSIVGIAATAILLLLGVRNLLLTLPLSLALGVYSLLCWPWTATGRPEKPLRSEIDKFVTLTALGSIASSGLLQVTQLVTQYFFDDAAAGVIGVAVQLATPLAIITGGLTAVLMPMLAKAHGAGDMDKMRSHTNLATRGFVTVLVAFFGAVALAARPIIFILYDWRGLHQYATAAPLIPAFCLALLVQNSVAPSVSAITSGDQKHVWIPTVVPYAGFATALLAWVLFMPRLQLFGIAAGYAVGMIVTQAILFIVAWRLTKQRWTGVATTLAAGCAAIAAGSWAVQQFSTSYWIDLAAGTVFALVWLGLFGPRFLRRLKAARG